MITSVFMCGIIGKNASDNARYLEVERNYKNHEGKFQKDLIPVVFWTRTANNFFMNLKEGTRVIVSGRLEHFETMGLGVVCDTLEYLGANPIETLEEQQKVV